MLRNRTGIARLVVCVAWLGAPAAWGQEALPSVDEVLDRYVAAIGGRAAVEKLSSRVSRGTMDLPELDAHGTVVFYGKAPNKSRYTLNIEGVGAIEQAFNGTTGWASNPEAGVRDLTAEEVTYIRLAADFHAPLNLRHSYTELAVKAREAGDAGEVYVVTAKQPDGRPRTMYFDVASGLLVRYVAERGTPDGVLIVDNRLEDYREVDGVRLPHTIRQQNPQFTSIIRLTEIQHNVSVDDATFEKPQER
jgi:hypothetical protein